jgi:hypothetical protein
MDRAKRYGAAFAAFDNMIQRTASVNTPDAAETSTPVRAPGMKKL